MLVDLPSLIVSGGGYVFGMGKHTGAHIVWDWNGTLFHDNDAIIGATNAAFAELGLAPITMEQYRALYCVPVPKFYERLLGRLPTDAEWEVMDETFHRYYTEHRVACGLTEGAAELLADWRSAGRSQSILSMYGHERAGPAGAGVRDRGALHTRRRADRAVRGQQGGAHGAAPRGAAAGVDPARTVVIGDAADDAVAALHVGARAVLYTGGSHSRASLEGVGVPVVDTLGEAVAEAERLAA